MRLLRYRNNSNNESDDVRDVTHIIIDESVTTIRAYAFKNYFKLVSVTMNDTVVTIEREAFSNCPRLKFVRLSTALRRIGESAFMNCIAMNTIILPSSLKYIEEKAFYGCLKLTPFILPKGIRPDNVGYVIIWHTPIERLAIRDGNPYENDAEHPSNHNNSQVNYWLIHYMDSESELHRLCYSALIDLQRITVLLVELAANDPKGKAPVEKDTYHRMTPFHIACMNPHTSLAVFTALFDFLRESARHVLYTRDIQDKTPLDYAKIYNSTCFGKIYSFIRNPENGLTDHLRVVEDCGQGMTPLHIVAQKPFASVETIMSVIQSNEDAILSEDTEGNTPLEYARKHNIPGLVTLIEALLIRRLSASKGVCRVP